MNLHTGIQFEDDICAHLDAHECGCAMREMQR